MIFEFDTEAKDIDILDDEGDWTGFFGTLDAAESALESLTQAVAAMREAVANYVQVRFDLGRNSTGGFYTYSDPSGTLRVGDLVQCPVYDGQLQTAKVVALGRGTWTGRTKDVSAKLEATPL